MIMMQKNMETNSSHLCNAQSDKADTDEIAILNAYHNGDPDYQPALSHEDVLKELGL